MTKKTLSIRTKLTGSILLASSLVIVLAYTLSGWVQYQTLKKEMRQSMQVNTKLVGEYCVPALIFEDSAGAEEILKKLETIDAIRAAFLFGKNGRLFSYVQKDSEEIPPGHAPPLTNGTFREHRFHVVQPVLYRNKNYGTIYVLADTIVLQKKTRRLFLNLLPGMTLLIVLSVLLAAWLQRLIAGPILKLAAITREISDKEDFSVRAEVGGDKEIEVLCSGFNNMLDFLTLREKEKKRVLTELQENEEKYRQLVENANDAIFVVQNGSVKFPNKKTEELTGYSEVELSKMYFGDLIHPDDRAKVISKHNRRMRGEEVANTYIFKIINKSGIKKSVQINTVLIQWEEQPATLTFLRDITQQAELEAQLQQAQKMEAIGTLAGGIAHDFNNILSPIIGHTEMLLTDISKESPFHSGLDEIYNAALRASDLVKQILTFSRQDADELKLMKIQPVIREALKLIRATIPTTIDIRQDIRANDYVIKANPTKIHQIIINLSTNAYHAMAHTGGKLTVTLRGITFGENEIIAPDMTAGLYVCLTIADTGTGMKKNVAEKIFDPFFTTKEKGKGTGMGLSVVHGIVTGLNGVIKVSSQPGKGTKFQIYFPAETKLPDQPACESKKAIQRGTEQILLVDDEEGIITMEKEMLERMGYQVTAHTSSIKALETFLDNAEKFDLVITDMAMPKMSGEQLAVKVSEIRSDIPILICTGFSDTLSEEKASSLGIKGFLMKPVIMKDLSAMIRNILSK